MHRLLLVTRNYTSDMTLQEHKEDILNTLEHDNSFIGEGGLFGDPVCDWFVIGGRWSGRLMGIKEDRDAYRVEGYPDDIQLITKELYDKFLTIHEYKNAEFDEYNKPSFTDLDCEEVGADFINQKVIVAIDYHY